MISIDQWNKSGIHHNSQIVCEDIKALKKAFSQTNSEKLFGVVVSEEISENWEKDSYNCVMREKNDWTTQITTGKIWAHSYEDFERSPAFEFEITNKLLYS